MEDYFEILIGLIAIIVGFAVKASKNKKKAQKSEPQLSAWDELDEGVEKRFGELLKKHDGEPIIPYAPSQPAPAQPPAMAAQPAVAPVQPVPVQPAVAVDTVPGIHMEGAPLEQPVPPPVRISASRPVRKAPEAIEPARAASRSRVLPERMTAGTLRSAFVMSEVLGKPVSLKNTARR